VQALKAAVKGQGLASTKWKVWVFNGVGLGILVIELGIIRMGLGIIFES